jgi:hypothetical protein
MRAGQVLAKTQGSKAMLLAFAISLQISCDGLSNQKCDKQTKHYDRQTVLPKEALHILITATA